MKKFLFSAIYLSLCFICIGAPTNSMLGAERIEVQDDEEIQNLWVYPDSYITLGPATPSRARNFLPGVWYIAIASNGYTSTPSIENYYWDSESFHNYTEADYSMTQFFALEEGMYELSFDCMCENSDSYGRCLVIAYNPDGALWVYGGHIAPMSENKKDYGEYKSREVTFMVAANQMTAIQISGDHKNGNRNIDVWNVVLKKVN